MARNKNQDLDSPPVRDIIFKYLAREGLEYTPKKSKRQIVGNIIPIQTTAQLDIVKSREYIAMPRLDGVKSWIILFHDGDEYYAVNFPKHNIRKRDDIVIHPIDISFHSSLYDGTIMEGVFFYIENTKVLVIDEIYTMSGVSQMLKTKSLRLDNAAKCFREKITLSERYHIYISRYFTVDKEGLSSIYNMIKTDPTIRDVVFHPQQPGREIFSYTIKSEDVEDDVSYINQFILKKTSSPDVYHLLDSNGNKKSEKIDIAYIPDTGTSKMCKSWFKKHQKQVLVRCRMDNIRNKWIPMGLID